MTCRHKDALHEATLPGKHNRYLYLNSFFVDGCFVHKVYIMCSMDNWRVADSATQSLCLFLTAKASVDRIPITLCPGLVLYNDVKKPYAKIQQKLLEWSAEMDQVTLCS
jgi:hypothetical protein